MIRAGTEVRRADPLRGHNREIADDLVVSVETVETQVHNIFDMLGVTSRGEIAHTVAAHPS